jgi:methyltransferase
VNALYVILLLLGLQRLSEVALDRRNTARLRARGAVEFGAKHYPLFIVLHGGWLLAMLLWVDPAREPNWWLVALYGVLQLGRFWVLWTLGEAWTTRIIRVPGAPIVRAGPYRFLRHPNYWVVVAEIAALPLAFGAWQIALVFSICNALLLRHRIKIENKALEETA